MGCEVESCTIKPQALENELRPDNGNLEATENR
jgi:hypothetical protein